MRSLKPHFSRSIGRDGAPLHFAAHSHHPWPDATLEAQQQAWLDAAGLLDRKWDKVFGEVIPEAQGHVARLLNLAVPTTVAFAPNTHEFVKRLLSCLDARHAPRILTTDSEFHSFTRQIARLEEDGLAEVVRVAAEPFDTFAQRFVAELHEGRFDLIFLSHVFFNSGWIVREIGDIVAAVRHREALVAIDGYHAFMATIPLDLAALEDRVFYIAGGYKYAMAGEGVCFMHCPPGYGPRPRDTGWYAEFGALGHAREDIIAYGADASRFAGSTFDPSGLYRFNAVQRWLVGLGDDGSMSAHAAYAVAILQERLLNRLDAPLGDVLTVADRLRRGRFLTFRTPDAKRIDAALASRNIIVDHRGDRLRIGFGVYQDEADVDRLAEALADIGRA